MTDCVNPPTANRRAVAVAGVLALGLLTLPAAAARAGELNLTETGSSLLYPLFNVWVTEYTRTHPGIHITTASTGSGAGIEQAVSGAVQIGASRKISRRCPLHRPAGSHLGAQPRSDRDDQIVRPALLSEVRRDLDQ
jgi:hypothetical protein